MLPASIARLPSRREHHRSERSSGRETVDLGPPINERRSSNMLKPRPIRRRVVGIGVFATMLAGFAAAQTIHARDRALFEAPERGNISEIDDLLRAGANVDADLLGDGTPHLAAARRDRLETSLPY